MVSVEVSFFTDAELATGIRRLASAAIKKRREENKSTFCPISSFSVQSAIRSVTGKKRGRIGSMISKKDKPMEIQLVRRVCFIKTSAINGIISKRLDNTILFSIPIYV